MKKTIMLIASMFIGCIAASAQVTPDATYMFAQRDTCDLYMDVYDPADGSETSINGIDKPTVIFMFGGGFIRGTRDDEDYNKWFETMTENG
jgi:carboxylesterase type B